MGIDKVYEDYFEVKDYDEEGRLRRGTHAELQEWYSIMMQVHH